MSVQKCTTPTNKQTNIVEQLWRPDLFFYDAEHGEGHTVMRANELLRIAPDGTVLLSQHYSMEMFCEMSFEHFPFDTQDI